MTKTEKETWKEMMREELTDPRWPPRETLDHILRMNEACHFAKEEKNEFDAFAQEVYHEICGTRAE